MIEPRTFEMPGVSDKFNSKATENYSVKYFKADIDDLGDLVELQRIETEGMKGDNIVILSKDKYTFLERYFIIVCYMERNGT